VLQDIDKAVAVTQVMLHTDKLTGHIMAVYGYCRVSTLRQANEGESLDVQRRQIEGYAHMHGLALDETVVDIEFVVTECLRLVEDAFEIAVVLRNAVVVAIVAAKEVGWRQLFGVTDDDGLAASRDGAYQACAALEV